MVTREEAAAAHLAPTDGAEGAMMREVFARYGEAMFQASVLEHGIVNAIVVVRVMPTMRVFVDRQAWEAAFDRAFAEELAFPFGVMLQRLLQLGRAPTELVERLHEAKRRRNKLAHEFFRTHAESVFSVVGKAEMLRECREDAAFFEQVDDELEALTAADRERHGITEAWFEARFQETMAEARARDGIDEDEGAGSA